MSHPASHPPETPREPDESLPLADPIVRAFEATTLDPAGFNHRQHLYVAWCYLRCLPLEEALARYVRNLRRFTVAVGAAHKYHATITWAYVLLLDEAMGSAAPAPSEEGFDALLARCPALLDHPGGALMQYYDRQTLDSDAARGRFQLPRPFPGAAPEL